MSQRKKALVQVTANSKGLDGVYSFNLTIDSPKKDLKSGNYYCRITSSKEIEFRADVYGIIPQQALRLALEVTAARLASVLASDITDLSGQEE